MARIYTILFLALLVQIPLYAHPGHDAGLLQGLQHPLSGLDHIFAMVALGLWAYQVKGRARIMIPMSFVIFMLIGALTSVAGFPLPYVEHSILASVFVIGILIVSSARLSTVTAVSFTAIFAVFHGHAHGTEIRDAGHLGYFVGFTLAASALLLSGLGIGSLMKKLPIAIRLIGAGVVGCAGILFFVH